MKNNNIGGKGKDSKVPLLLKKKRADLGWLDKNTWRPCLEMVLLRERDRERKRDRDSKRDISLRLG